MYLKEEPFDLPVEYNGQELLLASKLVQMGYTYKIFVEAEGQEIIFEPDEERNFRAVMENDRPAKSIPTGMIRAIGEALEKNFRT